MNTNEVLTTLVERVESQGKLLREILDTLTDVSSTPKNPPVPREVSMRELQRHLPRGWRSRTTILRAIRRGDIRARQRVPGAPYSFILEDVLDDINQLALGRTRTRRKVKAG